VWGALTASPGASAVTIATAAGVSKTAARRALATLETGGYAARTPGGRDGGRRTPDTCATPDTVTGTDDAVADGTDTGTAVAPVSDAGKVTADAVTSAGTGPVAAPASSGTGTHGADTDACDDVDEAMDEAAITEASQSLADLISAISAAQEALDAGDRSATLAAAEAIYGGSGKARRLIKTAANGHRRGASGAARSHPGELRAKVAGHLAAYPDSEFTPHEVGTAIGHSAGAVANALDRLTGLGEAVLTCDRPRRFTAPDPDAEMAAAATA